MIFSLDVCRARKGDCLLLHFGSKQEPGLVMIDGGPAQVYAKHLEPRIAQVRTARQLGDGDALPVDLLMVSHVDDDHIQGILDLTRELTEDLGTRPPRLRVLSFWHNSFDDIIGNTPDALAAAVREGFGAAALAGGFKPDGDMDLGDELEDAEEALDSLKVLASIEQGHRLRDDAAKLGFALNPEYGEGLIIAAPDAHEVADGLTFVVAGPMKPELRKLQQKHDEWLEAQKKKKKSGRAALAAYVDRSIPNLSSIVVLARFGGRSMLLTGDARGDKILEGLELVGLLDATAPLHVDILKVPHHGSANNAGTDFFRRVTADHYVFSGNGEHGNPERETIEMLLEARPDAPFTLHFTYPLEEIDAGREVDWKKERAKEKKRREEGKTTKPPRGPWSPARHGLVELFDGGALKDHQSFRVAAEGEPHVIDLLDPLGY